MIKSHVIQVEAREEDNGRMRAERLLSEEFNRWAAEHPGAKIIRFFKPFRYSRLGADYKHVHQISLTFFYELCPDGG